MSEDHALKLEEFLPYRLNRLADAISREFSTIYRNRHGLTRPEWRLLATLGQFDSMTATAVGHHSSMHKTKVSRAVADLEKRLWLQRKLDENDRRVEHLILTLAGRRVYRELAPLMAQHEQRLFGTLKPAERSTVLAGVAELERLLGIDQERGNGRG